MHLWLVVYVHPYEFTAIIGVATSLENAQDLRDTFVIDNDKPWESVSITEIVADVATYRTFC